jgi:hypothetical protein
MAAQDCRRKHGSEQTDALKQCCQIFSCTMYQNWPQNIPTLSILRPSKIYPNWYFWFENLSSGKPALVDPIILSDRQNDICIHKHYGHTQYVIYI